MGFLDKVKDTASKAAEKAQEAVSAGQEKLEDTKLKKRIGDLKEELGGIVYAQRTGTPPDNAEAEIARIVGEIQEAERQMAENGPETPGEAAAS
jgi:hypothetical protein